MAGLCFVFWVFLYLIFASFFFPFPLTDVMRRVRYRSIPWMTYSLIAINCVVFLFWQAPELYRSGTIYDYVEYVQKIWLYGYRESYLREGESIGAFVTFTSIFMHGDFFHLLGNMIYLWAFGYRVEDACGPWRFLSFYVVAGMAANIGSVLFNPLSEQANIPSIGASGAISGVLGAYLILFYTEWVTCMWGIGAILRIPVALYKRAGGENIPIFKWIMPLPALVFLVAYLGMNAVPAFQTITEGREVGGVGYLAHLIGFMAGLSVFFFVRKDLMVRYASGRAL